MLWKLTSFMMIYLNWCMSFENCMSYLIYMSYINHMSYIRYVSYVDYMGYASYASYVSYMSILWTIWNHFSFCFHKFFKNFLLRFKDGKLKSLKWKYWEKTLKRDVKEATLKGKKQSFRIKKIIYGIKR